MRLRGPIGPLTVVAALVVSAPAAALEKGVYIDPGSPAGKAYAIPLTVLRQQANGHIKPGGIAPSFGKGITPARSDHGTGTTAPATSAGAAAAHNASRVNHRRAAHRHRAAHKAATAKQGKAAASVRVADKLASASLVHPHSTAVPVLLISTLVLLGGLALGGVLRAVRRRGQG